MLKALVVGLTVFVASYAFAMGGMMGNGLVGKPAPIFTLEMANGDTKSLLSITGGKKTVLIFWATWCPVCHDQLAEINERLPEIRQKGINVVLVDLGESREEVAAYLKQNKIAMESFVDSEQSTQQRYGITGLPTMILLDEQRIIRSFGHQFPSDYL